MAIPQVNSIPKYELTIPSTQKVTTFRPFLVKEQKVMLIALESQDQQAILRAIMDTLSATVDSIDVNQLSTFDIEYMFTVVRSKSVGETVDLMLPCSNCEHLNEINIDISDLEIKIPPDKSNIIKLNDQYELHLRYPTYKQVLDNAGNEKTIVENLYTTSLLSMDKLISEEEQLVLDDEEESERIRFMDNLLQEQMDQVLLTVV